MPLKARQWAKQMYYPKYFSAWAERKVYEGFKIM